MSARLGGGGQPSDLESALSFWTSCHWAGLTGRIASSLPIARVRQGNSKTPVVVGTAPVLESGAAISFPRLTRAVRTISVFAFSTLPPKIPKRSIHRNGLAHIGEVAIRWGFPGFHENPETHRNGCSTGIDVSQMLSNAENISTFGGPGTARLQAQNCRAQISFSNARPFLKQLLWTASFERHLMVPCVFGYLLLLSVYG
jgi:hypothetical protein